MAERGSACSVSLQIVEGHGGTIDVQSTPGQGSVFSVWLPRSWSALDGPASGLGTDSTAPEPPCYAAGDADVAAVSKGEPCGAGTGAVGRPSDRRAAA